MRVVEAEGKPVIAQVAPGSDAETKGVLPGQVIVAVDGDAAEERISSLVPLITASAPWHARSAAVATVLDGALDQAVQVELRHPDGTMFGVSLPREPFERQVEGITVRILDGGIGLLRLPSFSASSMGLRTGDALVRAFDAALGQLKGTNALIVDMRGNGGGDDSVVVSSSRCPDGGSTAPMAR